MLNFLLKSCKRVRPQPRLLPTFSRFPTLLTTFPHLHRTFLAPIFSPKITTFNKNLSIINKSSLFTNKHIPIFNKQDFLCPSICFPRFSGIYPPPKPSKYPIFTKITIFFHTYNLYSLIFSEQKNSHKSGNSGSFQQVSSLRHIVRGFTLPDLKWFPIF